MAKRDRLPPQNLESERGVLGSILLDGPLIHEIAEVLRPDDFYRDDHKVTFRAMLAVAGRGDPVDLLMVKDELDRVGKFDEVGGHGLLVELVDSVPHQAHARYYAEVVLQKAIQRDYIAAAAQILDGAYSDTLSAQDTAELAERAVMDVGRSRDRQGLMRFGDELAAARGLVDGRRANGGMLGLPSGLPVLDRVTGGWQDGHMIVVGARPSIGKSAMLLGFAGAIAKDELDRRRGRQVLYCSLEMRGVELAGRFLSAETGVNGRFINNSPDRLTGDDLRALDRAVREFRDLPIQVDQSGRRTVAGIAARARRLQHREGGLAAVFIDYLGLLTPDPKMARAPRHEQVAAMSRDIKLLADDLRVPVFVACQVNRESERARGHGKDQSAKPPRMSDLRESGAIEQDADVVALLHRPEYYDQSDRPGMAELILAKNRGGKTGKIDLTYEKRLTRFGDPAGAIDPAMF